eukprot:2869633-Ditylum_brightwellii.AAC.1
MMVDLVHKIGAEAKNARKITGTTTLMPQMIQTGVKLLLPGTYKRSMYTTRCVNFENMEWL